MLFVVVAIAIPLQALKQDTFVEVILATIAGGFTNVILFVTIQLLASVTVTA